MSNDITEWVQSARLIVRMTRADLELRHLNALRAVAEERSFGRAADRLGFTQSAISQQIAALERIVGESMFDRPGGPKPVELTPAGRLVLAHAEKILDRIELVERDIAGYRQGISGQLVVGAYQSVSVKVLPAVIGRLLRERPDIDIRPFEENDAGLMLDRLIAGELDLTFTDAAVDDPRIESVEMCIDPFVVVVPASDPQHGRIDVGELNRVRLIGQRPGDACQIRIESGLARSGVRPTFVFRSNDNSSVQASVKAGMGYAVMPLLAVDMHDPDIAVREINPPLPPRVITLAMVVGRTRSPVADRFIELAREVCAAL